MPIDEQTQPPELILDGVSWDELNPEDHDRLRELVERHSRGGPLQSLHVTMIETFKGARSFVVMKAVPK